MKSYISFKFSLKSVKFGISLLLGGIFAMAMVILRNSFLEGTPKISNPAILAIPMFLLFAFVGAVDITAHKSVVHYALNACWSLAVACGVLLWSWTALDTITIWLMEKKLIVLNIAFIFALFCLLFACIGRWKLSVSITALLLFAIAVINCYVWQFRGRDMLFSDLYALGTALEVVGEYAPVITFRMALGAGVLTLMLLCQFSFGDSLDRKRSRFRWLSVIPGIALLVIVVLGAWKVETCSFNTSGSTMNGFYVNYIASIRDAFITAPDGYSKDEIGAIEEPYRQDADPAEERPNIIVIMNESFVDFRVLGDGLQTNQPVLPFYDSLTENTIRGYAYASAYGGSTANSEFEFLTGVSMGTLPMGSVPYQQYIRTDTFSLTWLLESYGYDCMATHPCLAKNWNRPNVYPRLGFGLSTFEEDYPKENMLRNWISDREMYEYVLGKLAESDSKEPAFIFGITMQNHGGYKYVGENYEQTIKLEGYGEEYPRAEQYLSVLHESDKALEYLISELEKSEEKTVLVFFGDHFPSVENELYEQIHGGSFETLDERMLQYKVPFFVWANYDIEEKEVSGTSLNYLPLYLFEAADMDLPPYYQFLSDVENAIPAMNAHGFYSPSLKKFVPYQEASGIEAEWLRKYRYIQYNNLFDTNNRSELFFAQYLP
ncbi:MAG: LTA synthase family protein [Ruminococcaceae bacterium]|nr:LTA synthase family protein [Oscillospiraceae bacterium]